MQVILSVFGFAVLLALVSLLVPIARRVSLPFTVLLALVGSALGFAATSTSGASDIFVMSLKEMRIPAEGFFYVFLPPLLFAGGLTVDVRRHQRGERHSARKRARHRRESSSHS